MSTTAPLGFDFALVLSGQALPDFTASFDVTGDPNIIATQYVYCKLITGPIFDPDAAGADPNDPTTWFTDWGADLPSKLGAAIAAGDVSALGPRLALVLDRDPDGPIFNTSVVASVPTGQNAGLFVATLDVSTSTAAGPLRLVFDVTPTMDLVLRS